MGEWHEVKDYIKDNYPCKECQMGWTRYSNKTENGKHYVKKDGCHETCTRLKEYHKDKK